MRSAHRLAMVIYVLSLCGFALFWLPGLLGTVGFPAWSLGQYFTAVIASQIPATIIVGLVYLVAWLVRRSRRV